MGYGRYDRESHRALTDARRTQRREEIFRQISLNPEMNPRGVTVRESRDSKKHPNSVGIMFWMDETGSMGDIPELLARQELPKFMGTILDNGVLADPQLFLGGIGDATTGEESPLQVGQFESEAELMDRWLTYLHLVGLGGGNRGESYDLAFYFAARHTSMDCWEKRSKKGYLFVTGDEPHLDHVNRHIVKQLIGDDLDQDIPIEQIVKEAQRTFHCFFLIPDQRRRTAHGCERYWRPLLKENVICLETPEDTCLVSAALIGLTEGTFSTLQAMEQALRQSGTDQGQIKRVVKAVKPYFQKVVPRLQRTPATKADIQPDLAPSTGDGKGKKGGKGKGKKAKRPLDD